MDLMGRYMAELGITPASRSRIAVDNKVAPPERVVIEIKQFDDASSEKLALPAPGPAKH